MKVLFLDFDGVLNSQKSIAASIARRALSRSDNTPVNEDLCPILCRNFQFVLDIVPDAKVVISSSWRLLFTVDELKDKLNSYGIDGERVIGVTPLAHEDQSDRGDDITAWLASHPQVVDYAILDDVDNMTIHKEKLILTEYAVGLTRQKASDLIQRFKRPSRFQRAYGGSKRAGR